MMDLKLQQYTDWRVKSVMRIKDGFGYRVVLKYQDGSERTQQKSGFATRKEAEKARELTVAQLYTGTYIVYSSVTVSEFMDFWLEEDIRKRVGSASTYDTFSRNVNNHIKPALGNKKMKDVSRGDIQRLYNDKAFHSVSVARMVKTVMNISFRYAVTRKVIAANPTEGVNLPRNIKEQSYHKRSINLQKTLTMEQIGLLLEKSRDTPIHMMVLFNVLMGLRRSEIIAVKYSDVDYINRTLRVSRQLGVKMNTKKEDFAPKTYTKQEIRLKTESSERTLPIPDYVFEEILKEREKYERNRERRRSEFQDLDYICCSSYGRPRSKSYHWKHYKKLLADNGLPDIRWHDLRSTFCTMLLKNDFNPKAVSKLMGHAKEIVTVDTYGDNRGIIADAVPELHEYMKDVMPEARDEEKFKEELLEIVVDASEYLPPVG